jgi:signal transduction histidine kinase
VAFPDRHHLNAAHVLATSDGVVLALIGGRPSITPTELARECGLLFALLKAENEVQTALEEALAARKMSQRATALASALDQARSQATAKAVALREALAETARLNAEFRHLNEQLEERVTQEVAGRLKVENALRQAQKMEAIGQLTGGVAHDFNNLLTVIMGGLENIGRQLESSEGSSAKMKRARDMALLASQRAAKLTQRLLAFSRRQPLDPTPLRVDQLVFSLSDLLQRTLGETVRLETVATPGLWHAYADRGELENALVNLAINARDAMPGGGRLTIETSNAFLDENYLANVAEPVPPGQYVMVAVTDTGHGIPPEILDKVFEPFFTTKEAGKGTGLGLSQVYGFVRQSGGHVRIYSEPEQGTTIKIYLPRHSAPSTPTMEEKEQRPKVYGGNETILVVEDDEEVRAFTKGVLRELGYVVLEASTGRQALGLLATESVNLLFTDIVLPDGMDGRRLSHEALAVRPHLKVLFTSGYTRNAIVHNGRLDAGLKLISKPFTFDALAEKIRSVLDEG